MTELLKLKKALLTINLFCYCFNFYCHAIRIIYIFIVNDVLCNLSLILIRQLKEDTFIFYAHNITTSSSHAENKIEKVNCSQRVSFSLVTC